MSVLLLDNYDSFTWNLAHLIGAQGHEVRVERNDSLTPEAAIDSGADAIVISPGPCSPNEAGISLALIPLAAAAGIPLLGVCLGHQAICQAYGGEVIRAGRLMHGKTSLVRHEGRDPLLAGLPSPFTATRYHSLSVRESSIPDAVEVLAWAEDDGEIMAARLRGAPVWGVQFHPESIASEGGDVIMRNFLAVAGAKKAA
ncbi:anthranilate synthase component II [Parvularcula dongshanensis]|uniref:Anthranilate synthase/aminodeoxychorismate synthase-like glutamine amidotransferase n=1 Tax=Parvularcula dongshanensis TaxID=1173995 RepID=A0A840I5J0_9PROT|nr:aminodeoxychorismate/anthranilate synthase component II [Parvularcula dongshanensis]MBB4659543.1 anthranilate synthase/aminodeoxychorismate synthase-like glutamine amidotransferase [Parvularcula dongshanensis]